MSPYFWLHAVNGGWLIIVSLIMLTGRGSFLLAGYNLMSENKKSQYDTPALCKFMGKILIPIAILVIISGFEALQVLWFWIVGSAIIVVLLVFYVVSFYGNRFKKEENT
ncbi:MAG: DUF3784 domain-containing protein [Defluviitaleaceae bacterium]|nr:DUF3784 domain-containing protein [Defluviitaleaceae bacterium]